MSRRRPWSAARAERAALALALLALAAGCGDGSRGTVVDLGVGDGTIERVTVDIGAAVPVEPVDGVTLNLSALAPDRVEISASCDTSGGLPPCAWDLVFSASAGEVTAVGDPPTAPDRLLPVSDRAVRLVLETAEEIDRVEVTVPAGAVLTLDVRLDGVPTGEFLRWTERDVLRSGAPSNPVELLPGGADAADGGG